MKTIGRSLGLVLLLISISGCTQLAGVVTQKSATTPVSIATQQVPTTRLITSVPTITPFPVKTPPDESGTNTARESPTVTAATLMTYMTPVGCQLKPVTQPPKPTKTFVPNELDPDTGLHVTGKPQWIDLATYRLNVIGKVDNPLSLTYDDLRCMPQVTASPELICFGVFSDEATWTGVPIKYILDLAGVKQDATELTLVAADGYEMYVPLETARADDSFLAYEVNGRTLSVEHGFPLRAVIPSMFGLYWVKWLVEIKIS